MSDSGQQSDGRLLELIQEIFDRNPGASYEQVEAAWGGRYGESVPPELRRVYDQEVAARRSIASRLLSPTSGPTIALWSLAHLLLWALAVAVLYQIFGAPNASDLTLMLALTAAAVGGAQFFYGLLVGSLVAIFGNRPRGQGILIGTVLVSLLTTALCFSIGSR